LSKKSRLKNSAEGHREKQLFHADPPILSGILKPGRVFKIPA
jgi:hypothetical protein